MRKDKNKAILLRKQGKSYNEIAKILDISKSTLSLWLRNIKMPDGIKKRFWDETRRKWAKNIIKFNKERAIMAREKARKIQIAASKQIGSISKKELFLIGIALYWAEGHKKSRWSLDFSNSDPVMIKLIMEFFRKSLKIKEDKFSATVQTHPNILPAKAVNYWLKITKIPKRQFLKTYTRLTPSSKRRRPFNVLPYGTLRISIRNAEMTNKMKGWISGLGKLV